MIEGPHDVTREFVKQTKLELTPLERDLLHGLILEYGINCEERVKSRIKTKFATWLVDWE
jgi:hypothetical protein